MWGYVREAHEILDFYIGDIDLKFDLLKTFYWGVLLAQDLNCILHDFFRDTSLEQIWLVLQPRKVQDLWSSHPNPIQPTYSIEDNPSWTKIN